MYDRNTCFNQLLRISSHCNAGISGFPQESILRILAAFKLLHQLRLPGPIPVADSLEEGAVVFGRQEAKVVRPIDPIVVQHGVQLPEVRRRIPILGLVLPGAVVVFLDFNNEQPIPALHLEDEIRVEVFPLDMGRSFVRGLVGVRNLVKTAIRRFQHRVKQLRVSIDNRLGEGGFRFGAQEQHVLRPGRTEASIMLFLYIYFALVRPYGTMMQDSLTAGMSHRAVRRRMVSLCRPRSHGISFLRMISPIVYIPI